MKTNLSSQITLTRIPLRYYRPENAFEHSVLTRLEKIPTNTSLSGLRTVTFTNRPRKVLSLSLKR